MCNPFLLANLKTSSISFPLVEEILRFGPGPLSGKKEDLPISAQKIKGSPWGERSERRQLQGFGFPVL
jgi:hypothetical protein